MPANDQMNCIIPARNNGQRLPGKSMVKVGSNPVVQDAINAAVASGLFGDHIYVDSEDIKVLNLAMDTPGCHAMIRASHLDKTGTRSGDVVLDVLSKIAEREFVCIIYPTAWGLTGLDLMEMWRYLSVSVASAELSASPSKADMGLMTVTKPLEHPLGALYVQDGLLQTGAVRPAPEEEYPEMVVDAGYAYMYTTAAFKAHGFYPPLLKGYPLPRNRCLDIGNWEDLALAQVMRAAIWKGRAA